MGADIQATGVWTATEDCTVHLIKHSMPVYGPDGSVLKVETDVKMLAGQTINSLLEYVLRRVK